VAWPYGESIGELTCEIFILRKVEVIERKGERRLERDRKAWAHRHEHASLRR
jgi:hypothetical protein